MLLCESNNENGHISRNLGKMYVVKLNSKKGCISGKIRLC